ncbi:unnamed protein product [Heterosigma akashiwo]|uniref:50S ribosomal protein L10 n=1 Tax=Heterosigma akashiwo TaxID=2829 RepID=A0A6T5QIA2_HETAK|mmetsp:Transcript_11425/g.18291  ORF Transcript_11425/g.18291 Transcript_11425/m.18291 type:complete len:213 (-) Transcript_11425:340-978(-)
MLSKLFLIAFLAVWSVALSFTVRSGIHMGGAAGFKSTKAGKEAVVGELKTLLDSSTVIFGVNTARRTPKQLMLLRRSLPEGTKFMVCKNRLLRKAAEGTEWAAINDVCVEQNGYFFIEDDIQGSVKAWQNFVKDNALKEDEDIRVVGGVLEGSLLDANAVDALAKMPSKIELITRVGVAARLAATKIGKGVRLVPTKIGKGVKLAYDVEESA